MREQLNLAQLKNKALSFDRAEMRDVHIIREPTEGQERQDYLSKRHMGVWNIDKNELACLAPKSYMVIQHKHAVQSIIDAITSLNIKATAELKTSKHEILVDFDFPDSVVELKEVGEKFTSGIRIKHSYAEVAGLVIAARVTRLVCTNGMILNDVVRPRRIKYSEQLNIELEGLIDKIIKDVISSDEKLANMVSICMKDSVEWQTARLLAKALFRKKKHVKGVLTHIKFDKEGRVSRWSFYNAITEYCSKGERLKPKIDILLQNKAQLILKTPFDKLTEDLVKVEVNTKN